MSGGADQGAQGAPHGDPTAVVGPHGDQAAECESHGDPAAHGSPDAEQAARRGPHGDADRFLSLLMRLAVEFINVPLDRLDDAVRAALGEAATFVGADRGYVFLHDWTDRTTSNSHEWCAPGIEPVIDVLQRVPMVMFPDWMNAHERGERFEIPSVADMAPGDEELQETLAMQDIQSLIALPMRTEAGLLGFVGFDAVRERRDWVERERDLLAVLAELLANAELRRHREQELEQARRVAADAQRRLQLALRAESDLVWEHDVVTRESYFPPGFYRMLGWPVPVPLATGPDLIRHVADEDGIARLRAAIQAAAAAGKDAFEAEVDFRRPDGSLVPVAVSGGLSRGEDGQIVRLAGTARDLTAELRARREQERREQIEAMLARLSRQFVEAVPVEETLAVALQEIGTTYGAAHAAVLRRMPDGAAWEPLTHWSAPQADGDGFRAPVPREGLAGVVQRLGRGATVVVPDTQDPSTDPAVGKLLSALGLRSASFVPITVKGHLEAVLALGSAEVAPLDPAEPAMLRAAAEMAASALSRERARLELVQAREEADAANAAKTRFLSTVSHEIRTPLNGILGLAEVLGDSVHEERAQQYVRSMRAAATTLRALLDDVLDVARIESGLLTLHDRPTDVRALVDHVARLYGHQAQTEGVRLVVQSQECAALLLDGDRLQQVLVNLVGNALKFTEAGGEVVVRSTCLAGADAERVTLRIEVTDTGAGMAPEAVERVFQPFVQLEPRLGNKAPGTGLGLAIVREILDAMGGTIRIQSERGVGTAVTVTVEATVAPAPSAAPEEPQSVAPPTVRPGGRRGGQPHQPRGAPGLPRGPGDPRRRHRDGRPAGRGARAGARRRRGPHGQLHAGDGRHHRHPAAPRGRAAGPRRRRHRGRLVRRPRAVRGGGGGRRPRQAVRPRAAGCHPRPRPGAPPAGRRRRGTDRCPRPRDVAVDGARRRRRGRRGARRPAARAHDHARPPGRALRRAGPDPAHRRAPRRGRG
ncbi:hypothetical protein N866_08095 [Actinotalea ferrariae CF5-4]|uniref:histidine kinase n=1 Tax=Actinotalea ferrariae CF5-4 TaxID=948458 RepID=A0A021VX58_9CELL|nr:hypothetical protein N866_08095 [Actinotalea ferrariae CF5-4]